MRIDCFDIGRYDESGRDYYEVEIQIGFDFDGEFYTTLREAKSSAMRWLKKGHHVTIKRRDCYGWKDTCGEWFPSEWKEESL